MKFSFVNHWKRQLLGVALFVSCLGVAAVGFAEAKAFEITNVLHGSYAHSMRNEFFMRNANLYSVHNSPNSWGEVMVREESGMDGSVTRNWLIGDVKLTPDNNYVLLVKRQVIQKLDSRGNIQMNQVKDANFDIKLYQRMESGVKLEHNRKGAGSNIDIDGEYVTSLEYPVMSSEAAMYVLDRFMNSMPAYRNRLSGAAMVHKGPALAEKHRIVVQEHYPDRVVTRGVYEVLASGSILEYDIVNDKWLELTN